MSIPFLVFSHEFPVSEIMNLYHPVYVPYTFTMHILPLKTTHSCNIHVEVNIPVPWMGY